MSGIVDPRESARSRIESLHANFYEEALRASSAFREDYSSRMNVVRAEEMPFEQSPDGLIKHILNDRMNTKECCLDIYMQFLPPGKASGKHRHLSEEVFYVVEGEGYDLHWDLKFECKDAMEFDWAETPRKFEWREGDFVYIPPYCAHKHFNASSASDARLIVINSRIVKAMGFDWFEQLERAEGF